MQKIIIFLALFIITQSFSGYKIISENVTFEDNKFIFEDGFELDSEFAKCRSKKATFSNIKKKHYPIFLLQDDVVIFFNKGSILKADFCRFNVSKSSLDFSSKSLVEYSDKIKEKNLSIFSKEVNCLVKNKIYSKKPSTKDIFEIKFEDRVVLKIDEDTQINAKKAIYKNIDNKSNVYIYPSDDLDIIFTSKKIKALVKKAKINLDNNNIELTDVKGEIELSIKKDLKINFSSKNLYWYNFENSLLLTDQVKIVNTDLTIFSNEVELQKKESNNTLRKIIAKKNSSIVFNSETNSKITTSGIIELDLEKNSLTASSLKNQKSDLTYQDEFVNISAKKAICTFDVKNQIETIFLENDINLIYKVENGYAIADKIEYYPKQGLLKLMSIGENKVLFWQEDGAMKLSADEIILNQKEKDKIQGNGDVRFTFNIDEENLLKDFLQNIGR